MLSARICLVTVLAAALAFTSQGWNLGFLQTKSVDASTGADGDDDAVETGDQELDAVLKDGADAALPDENLDADDAKIVYGSSENEEQLVEDLEGESDDSEAESFLQTKSVDATTGSDGDDDAVETGDQELDAVLKDGADAALPDENLDADDAKIVYGSSENEEQLVEDLEGESDDSEAESFLQTKSVDATTGSDGDDDAVETGDQELDAVLKDGADAALPDENLDADDAKIVYGSSENEEQLVEDLEGESDDSEAESFLQTKSVDATTGSDGDDDAVETGDQELDAVLKDGADAALPDENLDADDAKIVYGSSENEEQLVEDLEAESSDSEADAE